MAENDIKQLASDLVNKLIIYKEPPIRESVFSQKIKAIPVDTLVDIIMRVIVMAYQKEEKYLDVVALFTNKALLKNSLGEKGMYELTRTAAEKGYKDFLVFLIDSMFSPRSREIDEPLQDSRMESMPLGFRKSLSKSHNRDVIEKLLYDPEPSVIHGLLNNPRITERDVVKIASRMPNTNRVLRTIYNHEKWRHRYSILCALALNPYTPSDITLSILPELLRVDLFSIINDNRLSDIERMQARIILSQGMTI